MENKKLYKELSNWDVPEDLWPGILSRLPVKSLLRFRTVSKLWLALIDDPEFARLHLKNFRNNNDETHLLVVQTPNQECVVRCTETFESDTGIIYTLGNVCKFGTKGAIVCSVDGLILLSHFSSSDWVWNPSIRNFRELPHLPEVRNPSPNTCLMDVAIGIGYDESAKDYKVVKFLFAMEKYALSVFLHSVAVFTLGTNLWKMINVQSTGGGADFYWPEAFEIERSCETLYFLGCLYWFGSGSKLVKFELSSEVLSLIKLPGKHGGECKKLGLVDGGRTIAAFYYTREEQSCSVWVLDNESMMWDRRYTFELQFDKVLHMKTNGEILVRRVRTETATAEEDVKWWDQVGSYRPESSEYKIVQEKRSPYYRIYMISHAFGWVESLILLRK